MAQMKAQMRDQLNANVKIYDTDHPGSPKTNAMASPKRRSIAAGSPPRNSNKGSPKTGN